MSQTWQYTPAMPAFRRLVKEMEEEDVALVVGVSNRTDKLGVWGYVHSVLIPLMDI